MERLLKFFTELTLDPFKRLAFQQDPEGVAAAAGLDSKECEAVLRSPSGLLEPKAEAGSWQKCAWGWDPGPDPMPDPDEL